MIEKYPSTLAEITAIASRMFNDPSVDSVDIETAWGAIVTVNRDLEVREAV